MHRSYNKAQFEKICHWCDLAGYLGIVDMSCDDFKVGFAKAESKQRYEDEVENMLKAATRDHVNSVGRDVFTREVEQYNQTPLEKTKKHRPETWMTWAGLDTKENRRKYHRYMSRYFGSEFGGLGLSYESWLEYIAAGKMQSLNEESMIDSFKLEYAESEPEFGLEPGLEFEPESGLEFKPNSES